MAQAKMDFIINTGLNKSGFNELRKEIQSLKSMTGQDLINLGQANSLKEAEEKLKVIKNSVSQMEIALNKAFNPKLGTVSLQKFEKEILSMGLNVKTIATDFSKLGAQGQIAFRNIAASALTANTNIRESHEWLSKMGETMMNTVKWGISSGTWNKMTGSLEKAYSYAKNLDKSLNNIRIVSEQSADQMDRFAVQANKAAKQLGKTTLDYTNAALIYYQQGLSEEEVAKRTKTTIKMANVTGEAAEDVSDYMTAVWNNFYDGSKSLEYYADVMTALGAATASSTDEIAAGLEKFAAVADTVGLSYEYATSALATVTAETRQSADTVGTAFKTLFARIQDLELGNTLDDGTTLGKYSDALNKVGINIMDSNNELKDMDDILNEMGSKWGTLTKAQQVSLAQTVAGTRQYAQLVALMDKWDVFQKNLTITANATGELNKQQEIYLESTQAHLNKLQAATERIYKSLIDSEGLNGLIDIFTGLVEGVANYTEALGGSKSALNQFSGIALKVFGKSLSKEISTIALDIKHIGDNADEAKAKTRLFETIFKDVNINNREYQKLMDMVGLAQKYKDVMTKDQQEQLNALILRRNEIANEKDAWEQNVEAAKEYYKTITGENLDIENINIGNKEDYIKLLQEQYYTYENKFGQGAINVLKDTNFGTDLSMAEMYMKQAEDTLASGIIKDEKIADALQKSLDGINGKIKDTNTSFSEEQRQIFIEDFKKAYGDVADYILKESKNVEKVIEKAASGMANAAKNSGEDIEKELADWEFSLKIQLATKDITNLTSNLMMVSSAIDSIKAIPDIWGNTELSTGEKILQTIIAVGNAINGVVQGASAISNLARIIDSVTTAYAKKSTAAIVAENAEQKEINKTQKNVWEKTIAIEKTAEYSKDAATKIVSHEDWIQDELQQSKEAAFDFSNALVGNAEAAAEARQNWNSKSKTEKQALQKSQDKKQINKTFLRGVNSILDEPQLNFTDYWNLPYFTSEAGVKDIRKTLRGSGVGLSKKEIESISHLVKILRAQTTQILAGELDDFAIPEELSKEIKIFREKIVPYQQIKKGYNTPAEIKKINELKEQYRKKQERDKFLEENNVNNINPNFLNGKYSNTNFSINKENKGKEIILPKELEKGFIQETVQTGKKALEGVKSDAKYILGFLTKIPPQAALAAIAIAAIGAAIYGIVNASKIQENQFKKAIEETQKDVDKANESYQNLKQTISGYKDASENMKSLEVGTTEFYEALIAVNEQATKLIEQLDLIAGKDYSVGLNGEIQINEDVLQDRLYQQQQTVFKSQAANANAKINLLEYQQEKMVKDFNTIVNTKDSMTGVFNKDISKKILKGEPVEEFKTTVPNAWEEFKSEWNQNTDSTFEKILSVATLGRTPAWRSLFETVSSLDKENNDITDITKEVGEFRGEYQKKSAEMNSLMRQAVKQSILGYGTKEQVKKYQDATSVEKAEIENYIAKSQQDYTASKNEYGMMSTLESYLDFTDTAFGMFLDKNIKSEFWRSFWRTQGFISDADSNYGVSDLQAKELYAINVLGYKKENDKWYDENGEEISNNVIRKIDTKTAYDTFNSGIYQTSDYMGEILTKLNEYKLAAGEKGVSDITSQEMIASALSAIDAGNTDFNFSLMKSEEFEAFKKIFDEKKAAGDYQMIVDDNNQELMRNRAALFKQINNYTYDEYKRIAYDLKEYNEEIKNQAAQLETSEAALKLYSTALRNAEKDNSNLNKTTAKTAAESYKFNKVYNEGRQVFKNNEDALKLYTKALKNSEKVSYDVADAAGEVVDNLSDLLGLEFSTDLLKQEDIAKDIETFYSGTEKEAEAAFKRIEKAARQASMENFIKELGFDPDGEEYKVFLDMYEKLQSGIEIKIDNSFINTLNTLMDQACQSVEDVQTWLNNHGLQIKQGVDSSTVLKKIDIPEQKKVTKHKIFETDPVTGNPIKMTTWTDVEQTSAGSYYILGEEAKNYIEEKDSKANTANFTPSNDNGSKGSKAKKQESEKDPYQRVNTRLDHINTSLDRLEKQKERLLGGDGLKNLMNQIDELNQKFDTTTEKLKIANSEKAKMQKEGKNDFGIKFDSDGLIKNYSKRYDYYYKKYEKAYKSGNEDKIEKASEKLAEFVEYIQKYDEHVGSFIPGLIQDLEDIKDKKIETKLEAFNMRVEVTFELDDARKQWNDFEKEILNDFREDRDFIDLGKFGLKRLEQLKEPVAALEDNIKKMLGEYKLSDTGKIMSIFGAENVNNDALLLENLKEMQAKGIDVVTEAKEAYKQLKEYWVSSYDATEDLLNKQIEMMDAAIENYQHNIRLVELTMGEDSYSNIREYQESIAETSKDIYEIKHETFLYWQQELSQLKVGTEEWEAVHEKYMSALQEDQAALESYLESEKELYITTLNDIFETLRSGFAGGLSTSYIEQEWDLANKYAEKYFDTINRGYESQKIEDEFQDLLDKYKDSATTQSRIKKIMDEQMKILQEQDKLSQYDIDRARLKIQLLEQEIALEEARDNKNKMRLRRDSQGNYTYQYVADEDAIKEAEAARRDKANELYNFDKENLIKATEERDALYTEFQNAMIEANQIEDKQMREATIAMLEERYKPLFDEDKKELEQIIGNIQESAEEAIAINYGEDSAEMAAFKENPLEWILNDTGFGSGMLDFVRNIPFFDEWYEELKNKLQPATDKFDEIITDGKNSIQEVKDGETQVSEQLKTLAEHFRDNAEAMKEQTNELEEMTLKAKAFNEGLQGFINTLKLAQNKIEKVYGVNIKEINANDEKIGGKLNIPKYDTGGYTGDWFGDSGQFAMLHKKELVLNKQDTENLLNIVGIVRQLTQNLGGNAFEQLARMAKGQVAFGATDTGVLQQQVSIEANFPNVEHAGEIEEALNNLVNAASQKAGYKR